MMLTIHGLPPKTNFQAVKDLVRQECSIIDFILDNLVDDGPNAKKVRIGVSDDSEGYRIVKYLSGFRMSASHVLKIVPVGKPLNPPPEQSYNQRMNYQNEPRNDYNRAQPRPSYEAANKGYENRDDYDLQNNKNRPSRSDKHDYDLQNTRTRLDNRNVRHSEQRPSDLHQTREPQRSGPYNAHGSNYSGPANSQLMGSLNSGPHGIPSGPRDTVPIGSHGLIQDRHPISQHPQDMRNSSQWGSANSERMADNNEWGPRQRVQHSNSYTQRPTQGFGAKPAGTQDQYAAPHRAPIHQEFGFQHKPAPEQTRLAPQMQRDNRPNNLRVADTVETPSTRPYQQDKPASIAMKRHWSGDITPSTLERYSPLLDVQIEQRMSEREQAHEFYGEPSLAKAKKRGNSDLTEGGGTEALMPSAEPRVTQTVVVGSVGLPSDVLTASVIHSHTSEGATVVTDTPSVSVQHVTSQAMDIVESTWNLEGRLGQGIIPPPISDQQRSAKKKKKKKKGKQKSSEPSAKKSQEAVSFTPSYATKKPEQSTSMEPVSSSHAIAINCEEEAYNSDASTKKPRKRLGKRERAIAKSTLLENIVDQSNISKTDAPSTSRDPTGCAEARKKKLKKLIVAVTGATGVLSQTQATEALKLINRAIIDLACSDTKSKAKPQFRGKPVISDGALKLWCLDADTVTYLESIVPRLSLHDGKKLVVKRNLHRIRCCVSVPVDMGPFDDAKQIGRTIHMQNSWAGVNKWFLHRYIKRHKDHFLIFSIPERQVPALVARERRLVLTTGSIYVMFEVGKGRFSADPPLGLVSRVGDEQATNVKQDVDCPTDGTTDDDLLWDWADAEWERAQLQPLGDRM